MRVSLVHASYWLKSLQIAMHRTGTCVVNSFRSTQTDRCKKICDVQIPMCNVVHMNFSTVLCILCSHALPWDMYFQSTRSFPDRMSDGNSLNSCIV